MIGDAVIQAIVGTARADAARKFYTEVLGLKLVSEDQYGLIFAAQIGFVRLAKLPAVTPSTTALMAFDIADIEKASEALASQGVAMERYPFLQQDAKGVWTSPEGAKVCWFRDPDLNLLSLVQRPA